MGILENKESSLRGESMIKKLYLLTAMLACQSMQASVGEATEVQIAYKTITSKSGTEVEYPPFGNGPIRIHYQNQLVHTIPMPKLERETMSSIEAGLDTTEKFIFITILTHTGARQSGLKNKATYAVRQSKYVELTTESILTQKTYKKPYLLFLDDYYYWADWQNDTLLIIQLHNKNPQRLGYSSNIVTHLFDKEGKQLSEKWIKLGHRFNISNLRWDGENTLDVTFSTAADPRLVTKRFSIQEGGETKEEKAQAQASQSTTTSSQSSQQPTTVQTATQAVSSSLATRTLGSEQRDVRGQPTSALLITSSAPSFGTEPQQQESKEVTAQASQQPTTTQTQATVTSSTKTPRKLTFEEQLDLDLWGIEPKEQQEQKESKAAATQATGTTSTAVGSTENLDDIYNFD